MSKRGKIYVKSEGTTIVKNMDTYLRRYHKKTSMHETIEKKFAKMI